MVAENEDRGQREHHARRGTVDRRSDRLVDVVLNDAVTAHEPAQHAEAENRGELRAFDGKSQFEAEIADRESDENADHIAGQYRGQGNFRIGAVTDRFAVGGYSGRFMVSHRISSCRSAGYCTRLGLRDKAHAAIRS